MAPEEQQPTATSQAAEGQFPGGPVDLKPAESDEPMGITGILGAWSRSLTEWKPQFRSFAYGFVSSAVLFVLIFSLRSTPPFSGTGRGASDQEVLKDLWNILATQQKTLAPTDLQIAVTLTHIATAYTDQKKYAQAQVNLEDALEIQEHSSEPAAARHLITTLNALAEVSQAQGKTDQAQAYLARALQIQQQLALPLSRQDRS